MATLIKMTDDTVVVENPIAIKTVSVNTDGGTIEKTVTSVFCSMTNEIEYAFDMRHVVYCKQLDPKIVEYYKKLIESFNEEETSEEQEDHEESFVVIPEEQTLH